MSEQDSTTPQCPAFPTGAAPQIPCCASVYELDGSVIVTPDLSDPNNPRYGVSANIIPPPTLEVFGFGDFTSEVQADGSIKYVLNYTDIDSPHNTVTVSGALELTPSNNTGGGTNFNIHAEKCAIALEKVATNPDVEIVEGNVLQYAFYVTNIGDVELTDVTVTDPSATVTGGPIATLAPGATDSTTYVGSYTITAGDETAGHVINFASVLGTSPLGATPGDTAISIVATPPVVAPLEWHFVGTADPTVTPPPGHTEDNAATYSQHDAAGVHILTWFFDPVSLTWIPDPDTDTDTDTIAVYTGTDDPNVTAPPAYVCGDGLPGVYYRLVDDDADPGTPDVYEAWTVDPATCTWHLQAGGAAPTSFEHLDVCMMAACNEDGDAIVLNASSVGTGTFSWEYSTDDGASFTTLPGTSATEQITDAAALSGGAIVIVTMTNASGEQAIACGMAKGCTSAPVDGQTDVVFFEVKTTPTCVGFDVDTPYASSYENGQYLTTAAGGVGNGANPGGIGIDAKQVAITNPNAFPVIVHFDVSQAAISYGVNAGILSESIMYQVRIADDLTDAGLLSAPAPIYDDREDGSFTTPFISGDEDGRWIFPLDAEYNINNVHLLTSAGEGWGGVIGGFQSNSAFITIPANATRNMIAVRWGFLSTDNPTPTGVYGSGPSVVIHHSYRINFRMETNPCCGRLPVTFEESNVLIPQGEF